MNSAGPEVKTRAAISWSGGKDSYLAFRRMRTHLNFTSLITMFDEEGERSRSHGLRPQIVEQHAHRLGLTLLPGRCSWAGYTAEFERVLKQARAGGVTDAVFGDIFGESHRAWVEGVCARVGVRAHLPLWASDTHELFSEFLRTGAEAHIVTVNSKWLDSTWLGRALSADMLPDFARLGVDPCGENGEYHTLLINAPEFAAPLDVRSGVRVQRDGCFALDYL